MIVYLSPNASPSHTEKASGEEYDAEPDETAGRFRNDMRLAAQFFALSIILFAAIHGIISRSLLPTCSMLCASVLRRLAVMLG